MTKKSYSVSGTCFQLVLDSEGVEGEESKLFAPHKTQVSNRELMKNISKDVIMQFLEFDETEVYIVPAEHGEYDLIAYNSISDESLRISGIGNHFVALIETIKSANNKRKEITNNPQATIITDRFIKKINELLLLDRYGECAIGEYRTVDFLGNPVDVCVGRIDENGQRQKLNCIDLETSINNNIPKKMKELVTWTNENIKHGCPIEKIAEFHARFIKIHPFRDGNGRTARLLTNYLLLIAGYPMMNIPAEKKDEYVINLNYANATSQESFVNESKEYEKFDKFVTLIQGERSEENKYYPLAKFLCTCLLKENSKALINRIINYRKEGASLDKLNAHEILSPNFIYES